MSPQGVCVSRGCFSQEDSHSCCPVPVTGDLEGALGHWWAVDLVFVTFPAGLVPPALKEGWR